MDLISRAWFAWERLESSNTIYHLQCLLCTALIWTVCRRIFYHETINSTQAGIHQVVNLPLGVILSWVYWVWICPQAIWTRVRLGTSLTHPSCTHTTIFHTGSMYLSGSWSSTRVEHHSGAYFNNDFGFVLDPCPFALRWIESGLGLALTIEDSKWTW